MRAAGFKIDNKTKNPNFQWKRPIKIKDLNELNEYQKTNSHVGINNFGDKAAMWRHVSKQYRRLGEQYEICPMTYILPQAYKRWKQEREMNKYKDLFILKPTNMNCGKGIRVVGKKDKVKNRKNFIL